jgi:hypothetical protein
MNFQREELMCALTWMNLENMASRKKSQSPKTTCCLKNQK